MSNNLKTYILSLIVAGALSGDLIAQSSRFLFADKQFDLANYRLAASEYINIYSERAEYLTAKKAAQSLDAIYAFTESYDWWKKAVAFPEANQEDFSNLIRAGYRTVKNYDPSDDLKASGYRIGDFEEFSKSDMTSQVAYRVYDLKSLDELNSPSSEYSLSGSPSGIQFFASNRGENIEIKKSGIRLDAVGNKFDKNRNSSDGNSYYSVYYKNENGDLQKITVEGNELFHLSDPHLMSNGKMVFSATPNRLKRGDQIIFPGIFYGTFDLGSATVKDVKAFPFNQTDAYAMISPRIDEENNRLYFSSNKPGGNGGYDLYFVSWDADMNFSDPVHLSSPINSPANERDGSRFGEEFYFASDRLGGFGGLDVYLSTLSGQEFGEPQNLGQPINSVADDFSFIKTQVREGFFASDRAGGKGYDDLYLVSWFDRKLKIFVGDQSGKSLKEGFILEMEENGKVSDISAISEEDILNLIQKGSKYTFTAKSPGYFSGSKTVVFDQEVEEISLVMNPIPYGLEVYQAIIYYDFDKDFLRELSKEKMEEILSYMGRHPELNLIIESHTDSRASDRYNQKLSERRAKSLAKYLEDNGISGDRVRVTWFSESRLVNDCGDGVPCPLSAHQANRRSELKLIAFPDQNKSYELPTGSTMDDFESIEKAKEWFKIGKKN